MEEIQVMNIQGILNDPIIGCSITVSSDPNYNIVFDTLKQRWFVVSPFDRVNAINLILLQSENEEGLKSVMMQREFVLCEMQYEIRNRLDKEKSANFFERETMWLKARMEILFGSSLSDEAIDWYNLVMRLRDKRK